MFNLFQKKSKKHITNVGIQSSDHHVISFIQKLLSDVTKWKIISVLAILSTIIVIVFCCGTKKNITKYGKNFIAVIEIDGVIQTDKYRTKVLGELIENKNLKGVFLKINSPGGTITGSEILYHEIKKLSKKVPVYALIYDLGASGGYLISLGSTKVFVHETSITGSIGVLMQSLEAAELADKIGVRLKTYRSGEFKAQPDSFEQPSEEINKYMQDVILQSHSFFENLVMKERKISPTEIKNIANGKIFIGSEAVSLKLVDGVSTEENVKKALRTTLKKDFDFEDVSLIEKDDKGFISQMIDEFFKQGSKTSGTKVMAIMK